MTTATIFTFGFGQTDPLTGRALANRYVRVEADDVEAARLKMLDRFGNRYHGCAGNWAFDYPTEDDAGVDRWHLIQIDFATGEDIPS